MSVRAIRVIGALVRSMPPLDATAEQRAEWLELKALTLEQFAVEHRALAAEADGYARVARQQAGRLRGRRS